ncbi:hypothetical protein X738_27660 [Mesorhizobium sp. LNHC209A00]|nr:hypothetical protein X738_27660 [Mesorhizobium sp. LNHC209A00]
MSYEIRLESYGVFRAGVGIRKGSNRAGDLMVIKRIGDEGPARSTLASSVYCRLREDLLEGQLGAKGKLRVGWIASHYGAGATPVREALNRLASEGLISHHDQRGFAIKPVSTAELEELTRTRCWLEAIALQNSIAARTFAWEEHVVLALHRLERASRGEMAGTLNADFEKLHRQFHRTLLSGCGSAWLARFCDQLADQVYRYRVIAKDNANEHGLCLNEHRLIAELAVDGNASGAIEALIHHYELSAARCMERVLQREPSRSNPPECVRVHNAAGQSA